MTVYSGANRCVPEPLFGPQNSFIAVPQAACDDLRVVWLRGTQGSIDFSTSFPNNKRSFRHETGYPAQYETRRPKSTPFSRLRDSQDWIESSGGFRRKGRRLDRRSSGTKSYLASSTMLRRTFQSSNS